jgi:hypothetical protein
MASTASKRVEHVMFAPTVEPAFLNGVGSRVAESGLGLISGHPYSAPYSLSCTASGSGQRADADFGQIHHYAQHHPLRRRDRLLVLNGTQAD